MHRPMFQVLKATKRTIFKGRLTRVTYMLSCGCTTVRTYMGKAKDCTPLTAAWCTDKHSSFNIRRTLAPLTALALVLSAVGCAAQVEAPAPAPEPAPTVATPVPCNSTPTIDPIVDPAPTCTSDPCDNVACKTADGQAWIRNYQACTCTCRIPW
jgi:hypothetical protein